MVPTMRDVPIHLKAEELLEAQRQKHRSATWRAVVEEAINIGQALMAPAAVYELFAVATVAEEEVTLVSDGESTTTLHVGPHAELLAPAAQVIVAVSTIGPALEARVSALHQERENLLAYALDSVGVMALGKVTEALFRLAEERAAERGWGIGPAMSPGSLVGWPVETQRELCALLPLEHIGVALNDYCVLEPHKSASCLVGIGPEYPDHNVGSLCQLCALRDHCWRRRQG